MNILLVGIQGSGKGTQARKILEKFPASFFEMGQKLRNFTTLGHEKSAEVKECLEAGKLVSPELVATILKHYRDTHEGGRIIFDGIPRNADQKSLFDGVFPEYFVIFLDLDRDEAIRRLAGRRIDPTTGESFPGDFKGDFSPFTGVKLVKRDDDHPEAVAKRIDTFYQNTLPLLAAWANEGRRVYHIDASKSVDEVFSHIEVVLSAYGDGR